VVTWNEVNFDGTGFRALIAQSQPCTGACSGGMTFSTPLELRRPNVSSDTRPFTRVVEPGNSEACYFGDYIGLTGANGSFLAAWTDPRAAFDTNVSTDPHIREQATQVWGNRFTPSSPHAPLG